MLLSQLHKSHLETLRFLSGSPRIKLNWTQLRLHGYILGPNQEVLMLTESCKLRECIYGLPCSHICGGIIKRLCTDRPRQKDGTPYGIIKSWDNDNNEVVS